VFFDKAVMGQLRVKKKRFRLLSCSIFITKLYLPLSLPSSTFLSRYQALPSSLVTKLCLVTDELEMLHFYIRSQTPWGWTLPNWSLV